ncbi:hypothetical protein BBSC_1591 [Bifidobacterium scardovii JCM 12489 = DSM 13734]|nr:hypothetical protein BBSC_1591 [Bifidobacterium scardovii JCM 12489 = DSM 13734]
MRARSACAPTDLRPAGLQPFPISETAASQRGGIVVDGIRSACSAGRTVSQQGRRGIADLRSLCVRETAVSRRGVLGEAVPR